MPLTFLKVLHVFLKELGESDKHVWVCAHTYTSNPNIKESLLSEKEDT